MISELSPQFPCSHESDRVVRAAVEELLARGGGTVSDDIRQLVYAAQRALNTSAYKPTDTRDGSEDGRAEEGEVQDAAAAAAAGGSGGGGGAGAGGDGAIGAPRGRGAAMAPVDAVGHKRGRDGYAGGGGGGGDGARRGPPARSGHRGSAGR